MDISELKPKQGKVDITAEVIEKSESREFNKFGKAGKVCNARIKDSTGSISLTLWNEQVDQVNVGDNVKITNGYVNEWQGEMQLSTGKFGSLEVVGQSAGSEPGSRESDPSSDTLSSDEPSPDGDSHEVSGSEESQPSSDDSSENSSVIDIEEEKIE